MGAASSGPVSCTVVDGVGAGTGGACEEDTGTGAGATIGKVHSGTMDFGGVAVVALAVLARGGRGFGGHQADRIE